MAGSGQDEGGASAKWGAAPRLANGPTLASHLKVLGVYHVVVHSFFIRAALNAIVSSYAVTKKAHSIAINFANVA